MIRDLFYKRINDTNSSLLIQQVQLLLPSNKRWILCYREAFEVHQIQPRYPYLKQGFYLNP